MFGYRAETKINNHNRPLYVGDGRFYDVYGRFCVQNVFEKKQLITNCINRLFKVGTKNNYRKLQYFIFLSAKYPSINCYQLNKTSKLM